MKTLQKQLSEVEEKAEKASDFLNSSCNTYCLCYITLNRKPFCSP